VSDSRFISPLSYETNKKISARAYGKTLGPTTSSTVYVPCPDMELTIELKKTSRIQVSFFGRFQNTSGVVYFTLMINGKRFEPGFTAEYTALGQNISATPSLTDIIILPAGTHYINISWAVNTGTALALNVSRVLTVVELD
jgi:hypothetical protein